MAAKKLLRYTLQDSLPSLTTSFSLAFLTTDSTVSVVDFRLESSEPDSEALS
ncbi:hypothetical protein HanIR_Chr07g0328541 [Helianthus annuus]|nr:hypothetical protein HanIR_Chr07g0328541 [Helianthus annuus]